MQTPVQTKIYKHRGSFLVMGLVLLLGMFAVSAVPSQVRADHSGVSAEVFIAKLADEAISALTAKDVERPERIVRFRNLLNHNFDVALIGRWVLGRYWRKASDVEKKEYMALFEEMIVATYVDRFDQYAGEKLSIVKTLPNPGQERDYLVYSVISRPSDDRPIEVNWRVREDGDVYKIIDVIVEGVSMGQTQRSEFASVIRQKGGEVSGLISVLREKVSHGS